MPLIKPLLEQQIFAAFKKLQTTAKDTETAQRELAKDLATAIESALTLDRTVVALSSKKWTWAACWDIFQKNLVRA